MRRSRAPITARSRRARVACPDAAMSGGGARRGAVQLIDASLVGQKDGARRGA